MSVLRYRNEYISIHYGSVQETNPIGICQLWGEAVNNWGLSHMGKKFVIYGECPHIDKSHPLVTNPNPPQSLVILKLFATCEITGPHGIGDWGLSVFVKYGPIYSGYVKVHVANLLSFNWGLSQVGGICQYGDTPHK